MTTSPPQKKPPTATSNKPVNKMPPPPATQALERVKFMPIPDAVVGHRVVLYGTGGIGKSTLACMAPGECAVADADESLGRLRHQLKAEGIPLPKLIPCRDWKSLRLALKSDGWEGIKNAIFDTGTKIEEWCVAHTLKTVPNEKGKNVSRLEDYGWGKGYRHVYDTWLPFLGDCDRLCRMGINVIIVAHDVTANVPNPQGADFLRYEPKFQHPKSGDASIRLRMKEWADHVLFYGYDVEVDEEGVAKGSGTRTLFTYELPHCMAKSRTVQDQFAVQRGESPWDLILK